MTSHWSPSRLGNLTGKRIVVTGATNGVGLATAAALARAGAHVILAVRNVELGAERAAEMGGDTAVVKLDLADLSSVRTFPDLLDGDVDVLVNNAGVVVQTRSETVDGFEMTLGTNFLGPFALTNLMFPRVRSQIINVGSDAHRSAKIGLDDPPSAQAQVVGVPRLRSFEAGGVAVGTRPRPAVAGSRLADHQPTDPSRLGRLEFDERLRHARDVRVPRRGEVGGERVGQ